jgi:uncharacterized membrane protein
MSFFVVVLDLYINYVYGAIQLSPSIKQVCLQMIIMSVKKRRRRNETKRTVAYNVETPFFASDDYVDYVLVLLPPFWRSLESTVAIDHRQ